MTSRVSDKLRLQQREREREREREGERELEHTLTGPLSRRVAALFCVNMLQYLLCNFVA